MTVAELTGGPEPELVVRVNGHHAAWPSKFAAEGPRDTEIRRAPYRAANTSASLIIRRSAANVLLHVLVDCGMGVVNSLLDLQQTTGLNRVDAVVLTHPHFDHVAGLDWLLASLSRSSVPGQPWPLPVYCTEPAFKAVFDKTGLFHWWRKSVQFHAVTASEAVVIVGHEQAELRVSAVPVIHGPSAPGSVIYGVDFEFDGRRRRVGLAWDMLRLRRGADPSPLLGCDLLFVDSNTVHPQPDPKNPKGHRNWHISVEESLLLTASWTPRQTYLIHYSGSHDDDAPLHECLAPEVTRALSQHELQQLAARLSTDFKRDLRVADHGLVIPDHVPWPEQTA